MGPVVLSGRLQAVAAMVTVGNRVCDVGCDHGFVSIYLAEQGISPRVLAMDVRSGPLNAAKGHIAERGLESVIETRMSDGLHNYSAGEADTLICAGMGGGLMRKILSDHREKTDSLQELVLQPQSEIESFRRWLRMEGYQIMDENMIKEDGKFYPMIKVRKDAKPADAYKILERMANDACNGLNGSELCKLSDRYGAYLLSRKDKILADYLVREDKIYEEILSGLKKAGLSDEKRKQRYTEISDLLRDSRRAHSIVTS